MTDFVHFPKPNDPLQTVAVCGASLEGAWRCSNVDKVTCPLCKAYLALAEIERYNSINNDLDAYLFAITEWGLGRRDKMPRPDKYGLVDLSSVSGLFGKDAK